MSARSVDAESREHSPDGEPDKRVSKKRKVLSCYACRNRKMKCDRVYPVCGRCQKTGRADQCSYDPRLLQEEPANSTAHVNDGHSLPDGTAHETHFNPTPTPALIAKLRAQERRIQTLERILAASERTESSSLLPPSHFDDTPADEPTVQEEVMYRGKGFKSQFYGSTSPMSIMTHFPELQAFTREALLSDNSLMRIRNDFKSFRNRRKIILKEKKRTLHGTDEEIFSVLPQKIIVDVQVALYFKTWETSYRILHESTFWKEYNAFWEKGPGLESQTGFVVMLILMVVITKCMTPKDENIFVGDSSVDRDSAIHLLEICDTWLARQSRKHLTLQFFQLQCLSLLARRANCLRLKQDWTTAGDLLRTAIAVGMHRSTSLLTSGRVSEFEKEMKRRLWVTIMELELQSSFDSGLQSSLYGLHFDTQPPANLPDDAFSPETQQFPASRPVDHFTSSSYLNETLKSLPLRVHLVHLLNNPTTDIQYADVLHYDAKITSLLASLPSWTDPRSSVASALLKLQLYQFLLVLHRPYAKLASTNQRYTYSFTASVDAASKTVATYDDLSSKAIPAVNHFRNDVLRTAVALSQIVCSNCITGDIPLLPSASANNTTNNADTGCGPSSTIPPTSITLPQLPQDFFANTLCTSAIGILDRLRSLFEQKVLRIGTGYMEFWILTAAVAMMPSPSDRGFATATPASSSTSDTRSRYRQTIDHFSTLCFRVLALQQDPQGAFASSLRSHIVDASPSVVGEVRTPIVNGALAGSTASGHGAVASYLPGISGRIDGGFDGNKAASAFEGLEDMQVDIGGWTFPDFWKFDLGDDFY